MRVLRVILGACLAGLLASVLWVAGILPPPEGLRRRVVAFVSIYPGPVSSAEVERVECGPLQVKRFYIVCTRGCEGEWRLTGVTGLRVETLRNLNRIPREDENEVRERINRFIAREGMNLDADGARSMIACHMRLAGLHPELIMTPLDLDALALARGREEAMRRLAESFDGAGLETMNVREFGEVFAADFHYWDTGRVGRPVLEVTYRISRDGRLLDVWATGPVTSDGSPGEAFSGPLP